MEDYKSYKCPKCQIIKHIDINEKFDFKCKNCGGQMQYIGVVRKNSTEPYKKENYYVYNPFLNSSQQTCIPKCPTCGSTNIQKISGTRRWLSTGLFGIASSDVGKTMVCKNCGYKW